MGGKNQAEKIWYSFMKNEYDGDFPEFYDTDLFPWINDLETDIDAIREETYRLINNHPDLLVPYFNPELVDKEGNWKTLVFYFWSLPNSPVLDKSPFFHKSLNKIPGMISAAISKLEADTKIEEHVGDTSGVVRCHLPLKVPAALTACGIVVGQEQRSWEEGKMLLFCDAQKHRAFNYSNEDRIVLIIDVIHPLYRDKEKKVIRNVLSIMYAQKLALRFPFINRLPGLMRGMIRRICVIFLYFYLPVKHRKKRR